MNQVSPTQKQRLHPLYVAAAVAVLLFCAVGIAAMMGWLPRSAAHDAGSGELTASDRAATPTAAAAVAPASPHAEVAAASTPNVANTAAAGKAAANVSHVAAEPVSAPAPVPAPRRTDCASCGIVETVRVVKTRAEGSGVGAAGGAVLGGLLGNQVGGGHGRQLATVAGAIGGAVAGNQIEGHVRATKSYAITVRLDNGSTRTFHQEAAPSWTAGDRVRIVKGQLHSNE
jgi:outer membrane lipoprotein SlyB